MADSQSNSNAFSVQIISIDHYMAPPTHGLDISYSTFQGGKVNEVPVIRIYGSTPAGQKTCLHVHGVMHTHMLYLLLLRKLSSYAWLQQVMVVQRDSIVHGCSLVRARKFYVYHSSEEIFVKIHLYYPHDASPAANLLLLWIYDFLGVHAIVSLPELKLVS